MGQVTIAKNLKKTSIQLKADNAGNIRTIESSDETAEERMKRIKEERGRRLGLIK